MRNTWNKTLESFDDTWSVRLRSPISAESLPHAMILKQELFDFTIFFAFKPNSTNAEESPSVSLLSTSYIISRLKRSWKADVKFSSKAELITCFESAMYERVVWSLHIWGYQLWYRLWVFFQTVKTTCLAGARLSYGGSWEFGHVDSDES